MIGLHYSMLLFGMAFNSTPKDERTAEFIFVLLAVLNPVGIVAALPLKVADSSLLWSFRVFWVGALISPVLWSYFAGWIRDEAIIRNSP